MFEVAFGIPIFLIAGIIQVSIFGNISLLGGIIGIALGIAASEIVKIAFNMPMSVSVTSVIVSFAVCFATGVFFGWYPARKASRLDPIEALRFE